MHKKRQSAMEHKTPKNAAEKLQLGQAQFALDLLRTVSESDTNTFLSPVSIGIALAMTYAGTADATKRQMNDVLFAGLNDAEIHHENFSKLVAFLAEPKNDYHLHSANRMYVQSGFEIKQQFMDTLVKQYASEPVAADFKTRAEEVAGEINSWVADTTKQLITDLIGPGVLNAMTRLVLVNAIYFKGTWVHQFDEHLTRKAIFHAPSGGREWDMMAIYDKSFTYGEDDDCQVLGLPYKGGLSMFVFLPKERDGLSNFEKSLTGEKMLSLVDSARMEKVNVVFPKFKMAKGFGLAESLTKLGIEDLFSTTNANLSNITEQEKLHVSSVIHKAFVEVNEVGTEAAAATAVVISLCSAPMPSAPPKEFVADHPFLFTITNMEHTLFMGRFSGSD